jgi:putative hydrolases of HD superfamily
MTAKYDLHTLHTSNLLSGESIHPIINLFFQMAQLKNLYRQGWLNHGVSTEEAESVADHCFGVAFLGYVIAQEYRPDLDAMKVMQLGLFHEVGEVYDGDKTPDDQVDKKDRHAGELASAKKVFSGLESYIAIWQEFDDQKTDEAIFVKQVDRLEMALQADLYERIRCGTVEEYFSYVQKRLKSPDLQVILAEVIEHRVDSIRKL